MRCSATPYNPCPITPNAKCVIYTGSNLTNINVSTNDRLDTILININNALENFQPGIYIEDTITLDLSGDGTEHNPLYGDVNVSGFYNNGIQILPDGLWSPNVIQHGVVYGGIVTWLQDYDYHVSAAQYYINGVLYNSPAADFTLNPPDGVYNRIDTFIVDDTGVSSVLEGTPSDNPAQAGVDTSTQLQLSLALVEVGTTEPTIAVECLYKNNNEGPLWTNVSSNTTRLNPDSTTNPCNGTKSIEATGLLTGDNILFTRSSNFIPGASHSQVTFFIRSKGFSANNNNFRVQFEFSGAPVGSAVTVRNGQFGFNGLDTATCQIIALPFTAFGITSASIVNSLRITGSVALAGGIGFYLDDLCLQGQPLPDAPGSPDEKVKVSVNDTTAGYLNGKLVAGTGITLTENNNGGNETFTISAAATSVLTFDNGLTRTADNTQLGGTLLHDTVINNSTFQFDYVGSNALYVLGVNNSTAGTAGDFSSSLGTAVVGNGLYGGIFVGSIGVQGITTQDSGYGGFFSGSYTTNNTMEDVVFITRGASSGFGANGIGGSIGFETEDDTGVTAISGTLGYTLTDATNGAVDSAFQLYNVENSVSHRVLSLSAPGQLTLDEYGSGTFAGTPTYYLATDAAGNIIEDDGSSILAGVTITADNGLTASTPTNVQLGGTLIQNTTIDGVTFPLFMTSSVAGGSTLTVTGNTASGIALSVTGNAGRGMVVTSSGNSDVATVTSTNTGGTAFGVISQATTSTSSPTVYFRRTGNSFAPDLLQLQNQSTTAIGLGSSIAFLGLTTGTTQRQGTLRFEWTDNVSASRTSQFVIQGVDNAVTADLFTLSGNGALQLNKYGVNTFTGTLTRYLAVDATGNVIEVAAGAGGEVISADNGLTENVPGNVQLGGTLIQNTTVTGGLFDMIFTGTQTGGSDYVLSATNSSTGNAFLGQTSSGTAITGSATTSGVGVSASSVTGTPLFATANPSSTNTSVSILTLRRSTTGTAADGIGGILNFEAELDSGSTATSNQIISTWSTAAAATRVSRLVFTGVNNATTADLFTLSGNGALRLNTYGTGARTAGAATYALNVDANGNVIETALGGAGFTNPMAAIGDLITSSDGAGTPVAINPGTAGYVLTSNGAGAQPTWQNPAGGAGTVTSIAQSFTGGLISVAGSPITTSGTLALTVAGTSGGIPYFSSSSTWASSAVLTANAIMIGGGAGVAPSTTTTGTGVLTALGVNVGSAGAFVVNGGALGTPSSGTLTNATGLPISSGVSGLGTGIATALAINTGTTGSIVTFNGALGTPSSGTLTNATGLPVSTGISGLGANVATALAVAVGSAGAFVTFNGAGGTPSSLTLTNATGLPITAGTTGTLGVTRGGTGLTAITAGQLFYGSGVNTMSALSVGTNGQVLTLSGGLPVWTTPGVGGTVTTVSGGTTGFSFTNPTTTPTLTGTLGVANGGLGLTTIPQGGIPYGNTLDVYAVVAKDTNSTRYLTNQGPNNNPIWGQVNLANGVIGDLPLSNLAQGTARSVLGVTGNVTADYAPIQGTANQVLVINNAGTALTFSSLNLASSAAVGTSILPVVNGGTGQSTYTNGQLLIGNTTGNTLTKATLTAGQGIQITNGTGSITVASSFNPARVTLTDASTITWNINNGEAAVVTLGNTGRTLSITNPVAGRTYILEIIQDGSGNRTITTWPTGTTWVGGAPTLSTTAGAVDVVTFYWNGTNHRAIFNGPFA